MPGKGHLCATLAATVLLGWLGMRLGMCAEASRSPIIALATTAPRELLPSIAAAPFAASFHGLAAGVGMVGAAIPMMLLSSIASRPRNLRFGDEYGSARKGTVAEGEVYRDAEDPDNNIILTKHLGIAIRPTGGVRRSITNRNVLVVGGSGSGKTAGFVEPNLMQDADRDIVVFDPKGTTLERVGAQLIRRGRNVVVLNTKDMERSARWNPLSFIHSHADILTFVNCLVDNTNNGRESSDPIWDNGEKLFYRAILTLMLDWLPRKDMTMKTFLDFTSMADMGDDDGRGKPNGLDQIFEQIETGTKPAPPKATPGVRGTRQVAVRQAPERVDSDLRRNYDRIRPADWRELPDGTKVRGLRPDEDEALDLWHQFRHGAGKTLKSFVISSHARMASLTDKGVKTLLAGATGEDEVHLELLGQTKMPDGTPRPPTVTFVITSDFDGSLNCLMSLFAWQAINLPLRAADAAGGVLPRPVSLIFDEFKNIGKLPSFSQCISVVRSRDVDLTVILQNLSQLESVYGEEDAATIRGNCPTTLYLGGGRDYATAEQISKETGTSTIVKTDWSRRGDGLTADYTRNRNSMERAVYTADEVALLPSTRALVLMGDRPVIEDDKSWCFEHPRYDPVYQARPPAKRRFDYVAWRRAGQPLGEAADAWLSEWEATCDTSEAYRARRAAMRDLRQASARLRQAEAAGDERRAREARREVEEAGARRDAASAQLERASAVLERRRTETRRLRGAAAMARTREGKGDAMEGEGAEERK